MRRALAIAALAWFAMSAPLASAQEENGGWGTHGDDPGGYAIDFPADWTVEQQQGAADEAITLFLDASGALRMMIDVGPLDPRAAVADDLPNVRCRPAMVGQLPARRCLDTTSTALVTT